MPRITTEHFSLLLLPVDIALCWKKLTADFRILHQLQTQLLRFLRALCKDKVAGVSRHLNSAAANVVKSEEGRGKRVRENLSPTHRQMSSAHYSRNNTVSTENKPCNFSHSVNRFSQTLDSLTRFSFHDFNLDAVS